LQSKGRARKSKPLYGALLSQASAVYTYVFRLSITIVTNLQICKILFFFASAAMA